MVAAERMLIVSLGQERFTDARFHFFCRSAKLSIFLTAVLTPAEAADME